MEVWYIIFLKAIDIFMETRNRKKNKKILGKTLILREVDFTDINLKADINVRSAWWVEYMQEYLETLQRTAW